MKKVMQSAATQATKSKTTLARLKKDDLIRLLKNSGETVKNIPANTVSTGKNLGTAISIANKVGGMWDKILNIMNIISKITFIAGLIKLFQKYVILRKIWFWLNIIISTLYLLSNFMLYGWGAFAVMWAQVVSYWNLLIETLDWKLLTWIGSWIGSIWSFLTSRSEKALEEATNRGTVPQSEVKKASEVLAPITDQKNPLTQDDRRGILSRILDGFWSAGVWSNDHKFIIIGVGFLSAACYLTYVNWTDIQHALATWSPINMWASITGWLYRPFNWWTNPFANLRNPLVGWTNPFRGWTNPFSGWNWNPFRRRETPTPNYDDNIWRPHVPDIKDFPNYLERPKVQNLMDHSGEHINVGNFFGAMKDLCDAETKVIKELSVREFANVDDNNVLIKDLRDIRGIIGQLVTEHPETGKIRDSISQVWIKDLKNLNFQGTNLYDGTTIGERATMNWFIVTSETNSKLGVEFKSPILGNKSFDDLKIPLVNEEMIEEIENLIKNEIPIDPIREALKDNILPVDNWTKEHPVLSNIVEKTSPWLSDNGEKVTAYDTDRLGKMGIHYNSATKKFEKFIPTSSLQGIDFDLDLIEKENKSAWTETSSPGSSDIFINDNQAFIPKSPVLESGDVLGSKRLLRTETGYKLVDKYYMGMKEDAPWRNPEILEIQDQLDIARNNYAKFAREKNYDGFNNAFAEMKRLNEKYMELENVAYNNWRNNNPTTYYETGSVIEPVVGQTKGKERAFDRFEEIELSDNSSSVIFDAGKSDTSGSPTPTILPPSPSDTSSVYGTTSHSVSFTGFPSPRIPKPSESPHSVFGPSVNRPKK